MNKFKNKTLIGGQDISCCFDNRYGFHGVTQPFNSWILSGDDYQRLLHKHSQDLIRGIKTNRTELVKLSARIIGYAFDQYKGSEQTKAVEFASDLVLMISVRLNY